MGVCPPFWSRTWDSFDVAENLPFDLSDGVEYVAGYFSSLFRRILKQALEVFFSLCSGGSPRSIFFSSTICPPIVLRQTWKKAHFEQLLVNFDSNVKDICKI